jgi:WD40 repeat protein
MINALPKAMSISLDDPAVCVQFSPQGDRLAVVTKAKFVRLYAADNLELLGEFPTELGECLCFSPDGRLLVTGGGDDYMRLWDLETGEKRWSTRTRFYPRPDFSPDGKTLFVHYDPEELRLYDVESKEIVEKFNPPQRQAIEEFAFLPGGRSMITVGAEGNRHGILSVWDVPSGEVILSVEKRHSKFSQLAMTADSKRFYTAGNEFVCLWNATPLEELKAVAVGTMLYGVTITPDGNNVFTTSSASAHDNELRCWTGDLERDPRTRQRAAGHVTRRSHIGHRPRRQPRPPVGCRNPRTEGHPQRTLRDRPGVRLFPRWPDPRLRLRQRQHRPSLGSVTT